VNSPANPPVLREARAEEREALAELIRSSTNRYYQEQLNRPAIFSETELTTTGFVDLYRALEGSSAWVCADGGTGTLVGSCFCHERPTHVSLGIMNVHPDHFGKGIARQLLEHILALAAAADKPVRLVSSCLNLDSYSLYSRLGFAPFEFYQDMLFAVPEGGYQGAAAEAPEGVAVRAATLDDIDLMTELERSVSGICRPSDYRHFVASPDGLWQVSIAERAGQPSGFLASGASTACNMIGPGVALDEDSAFALMLAELDHHRGRTPVALVPGRFPGLVRRLYAIGGRNCETHVAQSTRPTPQPAGITLPTFLPESG